MSISVPKKLADATLAKHRVKGTPAGLTPLEPGATKTKSALNVNLSTQLKTAIAMEAVQRGITMTKLIGEMWDAYQEKQHG